MQETDEKTGQMFTDQLIQDGCFTFMLAGYETTATALPIVFYFMSLVCSLLFLCVSTYFLVYPADPEVRLSNTEESALYYIGKLYNDLTLLQWFCLDPHIKPVSLYSYNFFSKSYSSTFSLLFQYPEIQEKARQEVIEKLPANLSDRMTFQQTELPYTTAVIKESLRLFPTVNGNGRTCNKDTNIGEKFYIFHFHEYVSEHV